MKFSVAKFSFSGLINKALQVNLTVFVLSKSMFVNRVCTLITMNWKNLDYINLHNFSLELWHFQSIQADVGPVWSVHRLAFVSPHPDPDRLISRDFVPKVGVRLGQCDFLG
jgi:hypothetical protein